MSSRHHYTRLNGERITVHLHIDEKKLADWIASTMTIQGKRRKKIAGGAIEAVISPDHLTGN